MRKILSKIYVCYEEKSALLIKQQGSYNKSFVTDSKRLASEWAAKALLNAKINNYLPLDESYVKDFFEHIGESFVGIWVYQNKNKKSKKNYGLCIEAHSIDLDETLIRQLF